MKAILVPTDFSSSSDNSLEVAISLAERTGATIKLLHIIEGIYAGDFNTSGTFAGSDPMNDVYILKLLEKAKSNLNHQLSKYDLKGLKVEHEAKVGSVFDSISSIISHSKIDLIVMGMHSKKEDQRYAGSNTVKVVRKASCPVLVIKDKITNFSIRKLVLATDYVTIDPEFLDKIKGMQDVLGFSIHVLFVTTQLNFISTVDYNKLRDEFKNKFNLPNASFDYINAYSEEEGIYEFAEGINADCIAMTTHGRKGIGLFFFGSVSENLINECYKPILTFKTH